MMLNPISSFNNVLTSVFPMFFSSYDFKCIKSLDINSYNLLIFNIDGVLSNNHEVISIAKTTFNKLVEEKRNICVFSNECRTSSNGIKKELKSLGFNMHKNINVLSASNLVLLKIKELFNELGINIRHKQKKLNIYDTSKIINIGIVGYDSFYFYLKKKIQTRYVNVNFYWIKDNKIPENLDYLVLADIDNDPIYLDKCIEWLKINKGYLKLNIILSHLNSKNLDSSKTPLDFYESLKNKCYYETININEFNLIKISKYFFTNYMNNISDKYKLKKNNKILYIDDIDDFIDYKNIKTNFEIENCCVLSGRTKYDNIKYSNNENIKYIIPDISYLIYN